MKKSSAERFKDAEALRVAIARVRRRYESDERLERADDAGGQDSTPPPGGRGTGSSRRRSNDAVGVAQLTPPPDPRRTDREALARRRATQVEAALQEARRLFQQQQLAAALDACHQALTFDENHAGALELEQEIETALKIQEGMEIAADSAMTVASESPVNPNLAAGRLLESQAITQFGEQESPIPSAGGDRAPCRRCLRLSAKTIPCRRYANGPRCRQVPRRATDRRLLLRKKHPRLRSRRSPA